jgi:hypothetical protein
MPNEFSEITPVSQQPSNLNEDNKENIFVTKTQPSLDFQKTAPQSRKNLIKILQGELHSNKSLPMSIIFLLFFSILVLISGIICMGLKIYAGGAPLIAGGLIGLVKTCHSVRKFNIDHIKAKDHLKIAPIIEGQDLGVSINLNSSGRSKGDNNQKIEDKFMNPKPSEPETFLAINSFQKISPTEISPIILPINTDSKNSSDFSVINNENQKMDNPTPAEVFSRRTIQASEPGDCYAVSLQRKDSIER